MNKINFKDIFGIVSYVIVSLMIWSAIIFVWVCIGWTINELIIHYNEYQSICHLCWFCKV